MAKDQDIEQRIERLVTEHFPWGQPNDLEEGELHCPRPDTYEEATRYVESWLSKEKRLQVHEEYALLLYGIIRQILESDSFQAHCRKGENRFVARVDKSNHIKLPPSILEKMAREWIETKRNEPPIKFHQLFDEMNDLARLRVVVNFLSDMQSVCAVFKVPYTSNSTNISTEQEELRKNFDLIKSDFEDRLHIDPKDRKKGERCYKGVFRAIENRDIKIELQIVTMLQEAWDKKDHFLIYEPSRQGKELAPEQKIRSYALSESLYLHDTTFDQMLEQIYPKE